MKLVPTLDYEFKDNESCCYTSAFQMAWDRARQMLWMNEIRVDCADTDTISSLNRDFLYPQGNVTIDIKIAPLELKILAVLQQAIKFSKRFPEQDVNGIKMFRVSGDAGNDVKVGGTNDEALCVIKENDDEIWIYQIRTEVPPTFDDAVGCMSDFLYKTSLFGGVAYIPHIAFSKIEPLPELRGAVLGTNMGLEEAEIGTYYSLDSEGSDLLSYGYIGFSGCSGVNPIYFDKPFFIFQKKVWSDEFYFAAYVNEDIKQYNNGADKSIVENRLQTLKTRMV